MNDVLHMSLLNFIFLLLAIASIIVSIYFYFKSKKVKAPVYSKKTFSLVQPSLASLKNIEIKYNNSLVSRLSLTQFAFWNTGKEPIRSADIAPQDPIIIRSTNDTIIYEVEVVSQNKVNNFQLEKIRENEIQVRFDFISFNDGIVLNIFHSGINSSQITMSGTLIGAKAIGLAIQRNVIIAKMDSVFKPWRYLVKNKVFIIKFIGWLLFVPVLAIGIPLFIITGILEVAYDKFHNRYPKEFMLFDNPIIGE